MGKVIKKKLNGMSWWMKTSLILTLTLVTTVFMYQGWYKPMQSAAATLTYFMKADSTTNLTADGTCNLPAGAPSATTTYPVKTTMGTTEDGTSSRYYPAITNGTPTVVIKMYGPVYSASAVDISAISASFAIRPTAGTDTVQINLYDYNPAGAANNKTLVATGTSQTVGASGTTVTKTWTSGNFTISGTGRVAQNHRLLTEVVYSATVTSPRFYFGQTGALTSSNITLTETAVAAGDSVNVTDGTDPAGYTVYAGDTNKVADGFTMAMSANTGSVTGVTASLTNPANISNIALYKDNGVVGTYEAGTDTLLSTIASPTGTVSFTGFTENLTTTAGNYLIVTNISGGATATQTVVATVTGVTVTSPDASGTVTDSGTTLTIGSALVDTLTVSGNTSIATTAKDSDTGVVMQRVKLDSNTTGNSNVVMTSVTIDDNTATATAYSSVKVWIDTTASTSLPGTAVLLGSSAYTGASTVVDISASAAANRTITNPTSKYLYIVYDMSYGQTPLTVASRITAIAAGSDSIAGLPLSRTAFSLTAGINATLGTPPASCGGCHGNPPVDSANATTRAAGLFAGDHGKHTAAPASMICANCHTTNSANDHSDGQIQIASPLRGVTGESYGQATHAVSNSPIFTTCTTYCHSQGTSKTSNVGETRTASITAPLTAATWATTALTCNGCHNSPPNYASGTLFAGVAKANSHQGTTHAAQLCTRCHNSVTGAGPYTATTGHADGLYTVAAANVGYTYAAAGGSCNATGTGCHDAASIQWGASLGCIDCHNSPQLSPVAAAIDATVTSRPIMTAGFLLAQSHTRSRASKAATSQDCCVCHVEGITATGAKNTAVSPNGGVYHGNGYVELRDPDTGTTIKTKTHSGTNALEGAWSADTANDAIFVRFSRNLGIRLEAETAVIPGKTITKFQVIGGIMVNHCLKCHDSLGATAADLSSRVTGGTAYKPFGATVAANGTNQGVLDVASQFASANRSQHPVLVKNNNGYTNTSGTRLFAPWNGSVTKTGTTALYGALMSCWDCHAPNGSTAATTVTNTNAALIVDTHGRAKTVAADAVELRGSVYLSSTTTAGNLCLNCHVVSGGTTLHGAGSAMQTSGSNGSMTYFQNRCYFCHSGVETNAHAARPIGAGDAHGYNTTVTNAAYAGGRGYAFIRRTGLPAVVKSVGATAYTPTCGSATGICSRSMGTYSPGGVF